MVTIAIRKTTKDLLIEKIVMDEKMSMDEAVRKLLDLSQDKMDYQFDYTRTNIHISEDTLSDLKKFQSHPQESNNDILLRLLLTL